jgi:DhnA family fructose-bisphosphate aldolase class Ia
MENPNSNLTNGSDAQNLREHIVNINVGKNIRMSDFIDSRDHRCLMLDLTVASSVGARPGTEHISETLSRFNNSFDCIVLNPGQLEHHASLVGGKIRAAPLVRIDWTNAHRDKDFCLPASIVTRVTLSDGEDALGLGAAAVVATLLLGYGEDMESENIRSISLLARECYRLSLPLVVDICPTGDKVSVDNYEGSIKLGTSFMMEAGADALILPDCAAETCATIGKWANIPVLLRLDEIPSEEKVEQVLGCGLIGIVLSEEILTSAGIEQQMLSLHQFLHR